MPPNGPSPEIRFQNHVADFLVREHGYGLVEHGDIDPEKGWVEEAFWQFLGATQKEELDKLSSEYGSDARGQIFRALAAALSVHPLWWIIRHGLDVRGVHLALYYPLPRSQAAAATSLHAENRFAVRPHYYFGREREEVDLVVFLNGLPIVALELKHERGSQGWNVHNAVEQFAKRDHTFSLFNLPFLYLAADTTEVKMATDPRKEANFRWFNTGLRNTPMTEGEYPVEYLYREVLSPERLLEALSYLLVWVPEREAREDKPHRPAHTLFPRYHQQRMVRKLADKALENFVATNQAGGKYLIEHSAGSGKTLSICWLAERLHSLHHPDTGQKLVDMTVVLTDRKSLDKNIRDDIENFAHLKDVVGLADKAEDLARYLRERRSIIVSTQQKFGWILDQIQNDPALRGRRVAYLIDEAHRSQEGQLGLAIRLPFRQPNEPDQVDGEDQGEQIEANIAQAIREHDHNQLFVAFTATPSQGTVNLFGAPFDRYTEAEAIQENYIVDVAGSILSYETLYNLHSPLAKAGGRTWPAGVVHMALRNVAFQDEELIQYKSEVMLRIFDERVKSLIDGRAKAMIVATSRVAGLRYFNILREKLLERGDEYGVLFAFSDFKHPETGEDITEQAVNGLGNNEKIEDRFDGEHYRLMVVANKFQTGFDQPLLAGMFLDKPVSGRNAVQTVSRLNRMTAGKEGVIVVDFTNNAKGIFKAFSQYRQGSPYQPAEPDPQAADRLYDQIIEAGVFSQEDADAFAPLLDATDDPSIQAFVAAMKAHFEEVITHDARRREFVALLWRFDRSLTFLSNFFTFPSRLVNFAQFAAAIGPQLIKQATVSELMEQIRAAGVVRAGVKDRGVAEMPQLTSSRSGRPGAGGAPPQTTVAEALDKIRQQFPISDDEALIIREVLEEKQQDEAIRSDVQAHRGNQIYLSGVFKKQVNTGIQSAYTSRGRYEELADPKYSDLGGIFDLMAHVVIQHHLMGPSPASLIER